MGVRNLGATPTRYCKLSYYMTYFFDHPYIKKGKEKISVHLLNPTSDLTIQSLAIKWALGYVNSHPRGQREPGGGIHET